MRFLRHIPRVEATAALTSLAVGVALLIVKFTAYAFTGSTAIFSDAMESIVNVAAAGFALYALQLAHRPADREHPYGHGKIEFLSAGLEGGMMLVAAAMIVIQATEAIVFGPHIEELNLGLALMAAAMIVNGAMGMLLLRRGRRSGAITLEAGGRHLLSDAITSATVLLCLGIIAITGWRYVDPLAAMLVAGYIAWTAIGLLRRAAAGLMDRQDLADDAMLQDILDSHVGPAGKPPMICSYHKLRHRHSGRYHWVDFHLLVPAGLSIEEGHRIASAIEYEIEMKIGEGNATAHVEPCHEPNCPAGASTPS